jgi:hypothetical protein
MGQWMDTSVSLEHVHPWPLAPASARIHQLRTLEADQHSASPARGEKPQCQPNQSAKNTHCGNCAYVGACLSAPLEGI